MKENISGRIRRIITGTANTIVSKIEGMAPVAILEEAIREVDGAVDEVRAELGAITVQKHHVTQALGRLNGEHEKLAEEISQAHAQGRLDLVQAGLSRQIDIEDQLPVLENQLADLGESEKQLNAAITGMLAKRNEMEDELFHFQRVQTQSVADSSVKQSDAGTAARKAEIAGKAFERTLQNATGVRISSLKSSSAESEKLMELAQLNKQARIQARLKQLGSDGVS